MKETKHSMNRERSETGRKIGEEKEVKEKLEGGERQGEGVQGSRREAVCFQTISYTVESFVVRKVLLHSCVNFMSMVKQV